MPHKKDDVPGRELSGGHRLDVQQVAGSKGRPHAETEDPKARRSEPAQQVAKQPGRGVRRGAAQEFLRTRLHCRMVGIDLAAGERGRLEDFLADEIRPHVRLAGALARRRPWDAGPSSGTRGSELMQSPPVSPSGSAATPAAARSFDFSQSADDGPRMLPSMYASPGHRVQLEANPHCEQVGRSLHPDRPAPRPAAASGARCRRTAGVRRLPIGSGNCTQGNTSP